MDNIVKKTEYMIKELRYSHINFAMIVALALGKIEQNEILTSVEEDIKVSLPLLECAEFLGYKNNNPKTSKDSISALIKKGIKETLVTVYDSNDELERKILITEYKTSLKRNEIIIFFNKELLSRMYIKYKDENGNICSNRYIHYNLEMFRGCSNLYTYYLYELFKLYSYKKVTYDLTFEQLKSYLNIEYKNVEGNNELKNTKNKSYVDYKIFKRTILSPAIKYINENTDLNIDIIKEIKNKRKYIFNGKENEVVSLERIFFKISNNKNSKYKVGIMSDLAKLYGESIEESELRIEKLREALKNEKVYVDKNQIVVLILSCKDETLVKLALLEGRDKKKVTNLGGYVYNRISELLENDEVDNYKKVMIEKYKNNIKKIKNNKKKIKNKQFELTEEMRKDEKLVRIYEVYKINKGSVMENDVKAMMDCLLKYNYERIESAIHICFNEAINKGIIINSFNYIKKMLEDGRFNGRG
ncbi:replication initiation protein [Clostridium nigeriense]|uniref:replication initiation protein n=1 Tax=Clostridium nigeriense TaxID=1805470 RepID=UPI00082E9431|nr:replication initiation protein [Clostridium nigeriense]